MHCRFLVSKLTVLTVRRLEPVTITTHTRGTSTLLVCLAWRAVHDCLACVISTLKLACQPSNSILKHGPARASVRFPPGLRRSRERRAEVQKGGNRQDRVSWCGEAGKKGGWIRE